MHLPRLVHTALFVAAVPLALGAAFVAPAHASPADHYVALGDSYSSGVGAGGTVSGGACDRSSNAYPSRYDSAIRPATYAFLACGGATTAFTTCVLHGTSACTAAIDAAESSARSTLPGLLDAT